MVWVCAGEATQWMLSSKQSAAHTHDVRAMVVARGNASELVVSGGVDTMICSVHLPRFNEITHTRHR
jgi:predicted RNA methylase